MEEKTICPKCGEIVEPGWDICWNCQHTLIPSPLKDSDKLKNEAAVEDEHFVKIDSRRIVSAGRQIKMAVRLIVVIVVVALSAEIIETITNNLRVYLLAVIVAVILQIGMLINLYNAGNDLEKSVYRKK
jgi:hypothetical protein